MAIKYFKGDGSFIRNHYAIFRDGLGGEAPNFVALDRGYESGATLLGKVSYHRNSSFSKLIEYLEKIQAREAKKEKEFINKKLVTLREVLPDEYYLKISKALEMEDYSSAYTLLQNFHKDLSELKEEISSNRFRSFQKTKSFWATSFSNYLGKELSKYLEFKGDELVAKGKGTTIDQIVDNFLIGELGAENGIIAHGYEEVRQKYIEELEKLFRSKGIVPAGWNKSQAIFSKRGKIKNWNQLAAGIKGKKESTKFRNIGNQLGKSFLLGIGMEVEAAVNAKRTGGTALMTGRFLRNTISILEGETKQKVQQKGDVISFNIFEGEYDLDNIVKKIFDGKEDISLEQLREEITKALPELEIFEVSENIKGYKSNFDLKIEQTRSFNNRLANLKKLADNDNVFNKLIFILVNTTEGCLFDKRTDEIGNYIAAAFAAWMWDDYDEIYNLKNNKSNYKKLHIFNSGGAYFTASSLMKTTLEQLKNNYDENGITKRNVSSLVNVDIKPGRYTDEEYLTLRNLDEYALPPDAKTMSDSEIQKILKKRWDVVRAAALERGQLSISIRQKELDKLLGNLEAIIKEN